MNNFLEYLKEDLSWQYHIFLGLKKEKMNILEIGTHDGSFTSFLSKNYTTSNIFTIDLTNKTITVLDKSYSFEVDNFKKHCLLNGLDDIGLTLENISQIKNYEVEQSKIKPWLFENVKNK